MVLPLLTFDLLYFLHNRVRWRFAVDTQWLQCKTKITEALLILCTLLTMSWNKFDIAEIETLWLLRIEIWGAHFTSVFSVFSVMAGWIAQMLFMLFFAYIAVKNSWVWNVLYPQLLRSRYSNIAVTLIQQSVKNCYILRMLQFIAQ